MVQHVNSSGQISTQPNDALLSDQNIESHSFNHSDPQNSNIYNSPHHDTSTYQNIMDGTSPLLSSGGQSQIGKHTSGTNSQTIISNTPQIIENKSLAMLNKKSANAYLPHTSSTNHINTSPLVTGKNLKNLTHNSKKYNTSAPKTHIHTTTHTHHKHHNGNNLPNFPKKLHSKSITSDNSNSIIYLDNKSINTLDMENNSLLEPDNMTLTSFNNSVSLGMSGGHNCNSNNIEKKNVKYISNLSNISQADISQGHTSGICNISGGRISLNDSIEIKSNGNNSQSHSQSQSQGQNPDQNLAQNLNIEIKEQQPQNSQTSLRETNDNRQEQTLCHGSNAEESGSEQQQNLELDPTLINKQTENEKEQKISDPLMVKSYSLKSLGKEEIEEEEGDDKVVTANCPILVESYCSSNE